MNCTYKSNEKILDVQQERKGGGWEGKRLEIKRTEEDRKTGKNRLERKREKVEIGRERQKVRKK